MRVINLSYNVPKPKFTDPEKWLKRISFSVVVMESMAKYAEVMGIYHIHFKGIVHKNGVSYHFTNRSRWQLTFPFKFHGYVKKLQPDVVIVHGLISPWQVVLLRWQLGPHVKIIVEHHAERPFRDFRQYFQRWADQYIAAYLFGSLDLGMKWVEKKQIREVKKIKEIIGTSSTFCPMEKDVARSHAKIPAGKVFLWVGRLDANKDPWLVIRAFDRFLKVNSDVHLYMIYAGVETEKLDKSIGAVNEQNESIHFIGEIVHDELLHWYNSADFIISSSHYEGSGIAVCEALSCGCIPILTNIPSFRMMTDDGRIGLLYTAGDEDALVEALEKSLAFELRMEKEKVLDRFNTYLSSDANARKIIDVILGSR